MRKKQKDVLEFIEKFIKENCISPSYQDICDGVGIKSKSNVHYIIKGLEYLGYIERIDGKYRTLKLSKNYSTRKLKQENQQLKELLITSKAGLKTLAATIDHVNTGLNDKEANDMSSWLKELIKEIDNAIGEK